MPLFNPYVSADEPAQIDALPNKATPVGADELLIEDSADGFVKKKLLISNLPPDGTAIHKAVAAEISAMTAKTAVVGADLFVIEDSANANAKKKLSLTDLRNSLGGSALQSSYVGLAANTTTTSSYPTYDATALLSTTIVTTKASSVLRCEMTCCYENSANKNVYFIITIDGTVIKGSAGSSCATSLQAVALTFHHTVSAGSHTVLLRWCTGGGTVACSPVAIPNYHHCSLLVQELA